MPDYSQMRRAPAPQKAADGGAADHRTAARGHAPAADTPSESLKQNPQVQSLLQMRQALDEGPRVQSQLALQRALNPREAGPAQTETAEAPPRANPPPLQSKPNATGMPDRLKAGVESLSGLAMDDVRVHTNSPKPAAVQAHAYAQGTDIHLAPGQEKHLPHEAWHVVQQKRGRVKPTLQLKGVAINDDTGLEREADRMGARARQVAPAKSASERSAAHVEVSEPIRSGDGSHKVVAAQGGQSAGSLKLHDRGSGTIEVTDLGVPAAQRGSGVGHRLLASALQAGRRLGGRKVSLDADDKGSGRLINWYRQMGFSRTGVNARGRPRLEAPIGKVEGAVAQKRAATTAHARVAQRAQMSEEEEEKAALQAAKNKLKDIKDLGGIAKIKPKLQNNPQGAEAIKKAWNLVYPDQELDDNLNLIQNDEKKLDTPAGKAKEEWVQDYIDLIHHLAGNVAKAGEKGTGGHLLSMMKTKHGKQLYFPEAEDKTNPWICHWVLLKPGSMNKARKDVTEADYWSKPKLSSMFPSKWTQKNLETELRRPGGMKGSGGVTTLACGIVIKKKGGTFFPVIEGGEED
jgi:ribosomal protein S18 acetylase RimI-like enzyme